MNQRNLLQNVVEFEDKSRSKTKEGKNKKEVLMKGKCSL